MAIETIGKIEKKVEVEVEDAEKYQQEGGGRNNTNREREREREGWEELWRKQFILRTIEEDD